MSTHYNLSLGTLLNGRYKILSVLGSGGFGITYRCEHIALKQIVCIKELFISGHCTRGSGNTVQSQGLKKQDFSYYRDKFIEEARQLVRFRHPGIVQVQDVFEEHGTAYYAMEFIEGETLQALVTRKKQLSVEDMLRITGSLLDAVEVLHRADPPLLHRDIKPANIMLRPDGSPVLIDFGSAREYREGISISHSEILTPGYAPLEQYEPKAKRGAYTDVYSIGATMYVMLTGQKPEDATVRASNALKKLHDMPAPAILKPDIPEWISAAVMKALAIVSEDRYQSVAELRAAFQVHRSNPLQEARQALKALNDQTQRADNLPGLAAEAEKLLQRHEAEQGADWEAWRKEARAFAYTSQRAAADSAFSRKRFAEAKQYYERALLQKPDCTHSRSRLEAIAAMEPEQKKVFKYNRMRLLLPVAGLVLMALFVWYFRYNVSKNNSVANPAASVDSTKRAGNETARESDSLAYPIAQATDKTVQQAVPAGNAKSAPATAPEKNQPTQAEKEMQRKEAIILNLQNNMLFVQGGTFTMGCTAEQGSDCENDEKPAHQVTLNSFKIGKYEVTQEEWEAVMGSNPSYFPNCPSCPVENVSWNDIQDFINALNRQTGKQFRLPTEAEWEYAARGGNRSGGHKYSGSDNITSVAWSDENSGERTHPVGQKAANALGLYDMSGNVWEWCSDWYGENYYNNSPSSNPRGPGSGTSRVLRGGGWTGYARGCRVSNRTGYTPDGRDYDVGFRLVSPSS